MPTQPASFPDISRHSARLAARLRGGRRAGRPAVRGTASPPARRPVRHALAAVLATVALGLPLAVVPLGAPAGAATPLFLGWSALLPPLPDKYTPAQAQQCADGAPACVDATIATLTAQTDQLAAGCDHLAAFSLAYLRTTQQYRVAAARPGFFADPTYVNVEDAAFAAYYFRARDDWTAGDTAAVPPAWQIAFTAAAGRRVSGLGDLLLGMNAHINRDLPLVLASLGLVSPDGTSRKADHDKVNVFLNEVIDPLLREEAARLDPSVTDLRTPLGITWTVFMQIITGWREAAWRQAELLVDAPNATARATVARVIETTAATTATALRTTYSYLPPLITTTSRDAYCAAHRA
jgi:hypothetical protein